MRQESEDGVNETKPVTCLCGTYDVCGCDDTGDTSFLASLIGDGDYNSLNHSLVSIADINGTSTIVLNGTLPNGTTASGGDVDANGEDAASSATPVSSGGMVEITGYWVMIALVGYTCFLI